MSARDSLPCEPTDKDFGVMLMNEVAIRLSEAAPVQEKLAHVISFIAAVAKCDSCTIYLLEGDDLILRSSNGARFEGVGQSKRQIAFRCEDWVAENRQPLWVADQAYLEPRFITFNESSEEDRFESFLSVPLLGGGRLVGVINLQNRAPHHYSNKTVNLVAPIASLLGIQIERERLESHNADLSDELETRKLVNRAKSILQRDLNIGEDDAHRTLQRESQNRNTPLREIAQAVILMNEIKRPSSTTATKKAQAS